MPEREETLDTLRNELLDAILAHVPFDGWSEAVVRAGLSASGLRRIDFARAFPGGVEEVVEAYVARGDARMLAALSDAPLGDMKVRERIALAVEVRVLSHDVDREVMGRTLAYYALPQHAAAGLRTLYRTVDRIWRAAGDRSTDFNFYTKRALLAWVYSSTLVAYLGGDAPDVPAMRAFLQRRIDEVMTAGRRLSSFVPARKKAPR